MPTVKDIYSYINSIAPFDTCDSWDNSGILIDAGTSSDKILVALDITHSTVRQARELGCKIIVSHHPVIFNEIKHITYNDVVFQLIHSGISAICAHTNLDKHKDGVSKALAEKLCLTQLAAMPEYGFIGKIPSPMSEEAFAAFCAKQLGQGVYLSAVGKAISAVAVIGGSGDEFIDIAVNAGADCLVTGECGHHEAIDAAAAGISVIAAGHFETEQPVVQVMADWLRTKFVNSEIFVCNEQTSLKLIFEREN